MRTLSASALLLIILELLIFSLLWLSIPIMNAIWLLAHTLVTILASYWFSRQWRQTTLTPNRTWFSLSLFLFFLPIIGAIIFLLISKRAYLHQQIATAQQASKTKKTNDTNELNYFSTPKHHYSTHVKKAQNLLSTLDDNAYLRLLIASRHLPDKEAYTLLKEALGSPFESARLMAFSLKGKIEERLQDDIQKKIALLKSSQKKHTAELHLSISKDYMHLCDIGVLSESKENLLRQARHHCMSALRLNKNSAMAFQQLSKILKLQGKYHQAQKAKIKAVSLGFPSSVNILPNN